MVAAPRERDDRAQQSRMAAQRNAREACTCKSKSSSRPVMRVTTDERREGGSTARRAGRDSRTGVSRSEFVPTARHMIDEAQDKTRTRSAAPVPVPSSTTGGSGGDRPSMHAGREKTRTPLVCSSTTITMRPLTSGPVRSSPCPRVGCLLTRSSD